MRWFLLGIVAFFASGSAVAAPDLDGQWIVTTDRSGNPEYSTLNLQVVGASGTV